MKVTLHPTEELVVLADSVVARKWLGTTEGGHLVEAWVTAIGLDERAPAAAHREWEQALLVLEPKLLNKPPRGS